MPVGDQQINAVLESYWFKISIFHIRQNLENCQSTDQQDLDPYTYCGKCWPVLVINKSTPFWRATGSKFDFSTSGKIAKIANQQINEI